MTTDQAMEMDLTDFISRLHQQRITREIFRLPYPTEVVTRMLQEAVRFEVEYRGGVLVEDNTEYIEAAASWLTDGRKTPGLYIAGNVGNGKTTLLNAIIHTVNMMTNELPRDENNRPRWIYKTSAYNLVKIARRSDDDLAEWCRRPMIAVDDLGSEAVSVKTFGNIVNPAIELLTYRYDRQLTTIVTTNLKPDEIRANYGDRIADRLNEMMTRITIKSPTYRTRIGRK